MDWTLIWSAFGAIGTTAGAYLAAISVIAALEPYKKQLTVKLERLCRCSRVSVLQDRLLHAKAYWLQGPPSKLIMGS